MPYPKKIVSTAALALTASVCAVTTANALTITNGFTYAVASAGGSVEAGTHFHSNTGGSFGNPAGKAEVGRYASEEVRGLSEYSLVGQTTASSAFVTFDVFKLGGLFNGTNSTPFTGTILVDAYNGNNAEDISDYQAASLGSVGSFSVSASSMMVGDIFSFDISSIFNSQVAAGASSLGIRLVESRGGSDYSLSRAYTFDGFRLTSDNQTTAIPAVPEPETYALMLAGLGLVAAGRAVKRKR